jgi:hypothetical protein
MEGSLVSAVRYFGDRFSGLGQLEPKSWSTARPGLTRIIDLLLLLELCLPHASAWVTFPDHLSGLPSPWKGPFPLPELPSVEKLQGALRHTCHTTRSYFNLLIPSPRWSPVPVPLFLGHL